VNEKEKLLLITSDR